MNLRVSVLVLLTLLITAQCAPMWKVFCGGPLYRGRIDPIVNPGAISGHSHKVFGGNHFSAGKLDSTPMSIFNEMFASTCTTCSVNKIDMSAYWHPDLYYQWPNGSFSLVPNSGLTVYYLFRSGSGNQANPDWKPVPKGLRMLAGSPMRRSMNTSNLENRAINYACLNYDGVGGPNAELNNFPTDKYVCKDGLRAQVFFPMCWDGVNLDSDDHKSHMAYPSGVDSGNCPSTHPVRIPGIFFEALYSLNGFPHGQGTNPLVWSCGDPTGYGFHGDFLSGWDDEIMADAIADPSCDSTSTNLGNNVKACAPFTQYVQDVPGEGVCNLNYPIPLTEDLGIGHMLDALPGCNPLSYGPAAGTMCSLPPTSTTPVTKRFHLKSKLTGKYVTSPNNQELNLVANYSSTLTLNEVFSPQSVGGNLVAIMSEIFGNYWSANGDNGRVKANRGGYSDWEKFQIVQNTPGVISIIANRNGRYLSVQSDNSIAPTASISSSVTDAELFETVFVGGGSIGVDAIVNTVVPSNTYVPFTSGAVKSSGNVVSKGASSNGVGSNSNGVGSNGGVSNGVSSKVAATQTKADMSFSIKLVSMILFVVLVVLL